MDLGLFLRVEFLLKTDSGYPNLKDIRVALFTLATPGVFVFFVGINSEKLYSTSCVGREVNPGPWK